MNGVTKEIAEILSVNIELAEAVQDYMDDWCGIDWSEISQRELVREVKFAYVEMMSV
jgi:hypothetical protein